MKKIRQEIYDKILPLLKLLRTANELIWDAKKDGYKIRLGAGGSMGARGATNDLGLLEFSKDFVKNTENPTSPLPIIQQLKVVSAELKRLEEEGYSLEVSPVRPNGEQWFYLEYVSIVVLSNDFNFTQWDTRKE
jgi:hypothetical protein